MEDDIREAIEELKSFLLESYEDRLGQVILYGSHARGDASEDSDVDIMIVLEGEVRPYEEIGRISDDVYKIELHHGVLFSIAPVSTTDYEERQSPFLQNVRREGIPA